ncbi:TRAP transporter substrate-binding protein [Azospirillum canadense]|uniref:TRAP transporter substrate-binding protein n=1 Tax=Azospirillum canadense TaxID=403962 RepID=UPI002227B58A|nr:TRAP transporter substrate-binding protein DctP [Azospirillum canadense]MCW2241699.1 TRAP-type C4-dicarboxylate transport system substrate-binding protein [Azospirillum canadense]
MLKRGHLCLCAGALAAYAGLTPSVQAAEPLKIADYLPPTHYLVEVGLKPWMEEVTKATNGALTFQHFPSQQLGKGSEILRVTQTNVAQIGVLGVSFAADKMELSNVAQLPGMFQSGCEGLRAYMSGVKAGTIATYDFAKNGVHLLYPVVLPPFQLETRSKQVTGPDDLHGLKIAVATRAGELLMSKLGAVPMRISSGPDTYELLSRGTIDGYAFALESAVTYDLVPMTGYSTSNGSFGGQVVVTVMNDQTWKKLDQPAKDAITKASDAAAQRVCERVDQGVANAREKMAAAGTKMVELSPQAIAGFNAASATLADDWAKELDQRGRPASKVLKEFRDALGPR